MSHVHLQSIINNETRRKALLNEPVVIYVKDLETSDASDSENEDSRRANKRRRSTLIRSTTARVPTPPTITATTTPSTNNSLSASLTTTVTTRGVPSALSRQPTPSTPDTGNSMTPEMILLNLVDEIYTHVGSVDRSEESMRMRSRLHEIRKVLSEEMKKNDIRVQLMKGQLERRNAYIEKQREAFLKELTALREELFLKRRDHNHKPHEVMLFPWYNKPQKDMELIDNGEDWREVEDEPVSYFELRRKTEKVNETLNNLKMLEEQKLAEIEALQKSRQEAESIKERLIGSNRPRRLSRLSTAKSVEHLDSFEFGERDTQMLAEEDGNSQIMYIVPPPPDDSEEQLKHEIPMIPQIHNLTESTSGDEGDERSPSARFEDTTDSDIYFPAAQDMPDFDDDRSMKDDEYREVDRPDSSDHDSSAMPPKQTDSPDESSDTDEADEENLTLLEDQISNFQLRYHDLYAEMAQLKERLQFYQQEQESREVKEEEKGPEGQVTLVFTDVENSTRLWELDLDCMRESIKVHNQTMRTVIGKTNGYEVKTEGDAFMIAFSAVDDAVEFVLQAQTALLESPWPDKLVEFKEARIEQDELGTVIFRGLRVRMGIHTGFPIIEADPVTGRADYFGPMVNRSARVESQARGGQIVISSAVWAEMMDNIDNYSTPIWTRFIGSVTLKGMDEPETIREILPYSLRNRNFMATSEPVTEESSIVKLEEKVQTLQHLQQTLEEEREVIQNQIQFKLRVKNLEDSMNEKDNIIKYLRGKLSSLKKNYYEAIKERDEKHKTKLADHMKKLENDIDVVMRKYNLMRQQYNFMKNNYDEVSKMFNKKIKFELQSFKKDLTHMDVEVKKSKRIALEAQLKGWEQEKTNFLRQIENREKMIQEKDKRIMQLKTEMEMTKMNQKVEQVKKGMKRDVNRGSHPPPTNKANKANHNTREQRDSVPQKTSPNAVREQKRKTTAKAAQSRNPGTRSNSSHNGPDDNSVATLEELEEVNSPESKHSEPLSAPRESDENSGIGREHSAEGDIVDEESYLDPISTDRSSTRECPVSSDHQLNDSGLNAREMSPNDVNVINGRVIHFKGFNNDGVPVYVDDSGRLLSPRTVGELQAARSESSISINRESNNTPHWQYTSNNMDHPSFDTTLTVNDLTQIMKRVIHDAMRAAQQYNDLDWNGLVKGQRLRDADDKGTWPYHSYSRLSDHSLSSINDSLLSQAKNIRVLDGRNSSINLTANDLRRWGIQNAHRIVRPTLAQQTVSQPGLHITSNNSLGTNNPNHETKAKPQKKSYSRMLEHLGNYNSSLTALANFDPHVPEVVQPRSNTWDPLETPFRRVVKRSKSVTPPKIQNGSPPPPIDRKRRGSLQMDPRENNGSSTVGSKVAGSTTLPDITSQNKSVPVHTTTAQSSSSPPPPLLQQQQQHQQQPQLLHAIKPKVQPSTAVYKNQRREQYDRNSVSVLHENSSNPSNSSFIKGRHTSEIR